MLLLDASLNRLPWEVIPVLRSHGVCRLPCSAFLHRPPRQEHPLQATEDDSRSSQARAAGDRVFDAWRLEDAREAIVSHMIADGPGLKRTPAVHAAMRGWLHLVEGMSLDWLVTREVTRPALVEILTSALWTIVETAMAVDAGETRLTGAGHHRGGASSQGRLALLHQE